MLSGHERRALTAIEQHLLADDPALCRALRTGLVTSGRRWRLGVCVAGVALGALLAVTGAVLLSLGLVFFGCVISAISGAAFVRVRHGVVGGRVRRDDHGDDAYPTWWTWA